MSCTLCPSAELLRLALKKSFERKIAVVHRLNAAGYVQYYCHDIRMIYRRFGHKPWPSSANSEGYVTRTDHVTGDEKSASVLGHICWTN